MGVSTGRLEFTRRAFERFKAQPEAFKQLSITDSMERLGVSYGTIKRWRRLCGYGRAQPNQSKIAAVLRKHPKIGEPGKQAKYAAKVLAKDVGCSENSVYRIRDELGVLPYKAIHPKTYTRKHIPSPCSEYFDRWTRPKGIQEHLEVLRE